MLRRFRGRELTPEVVLPRYATRPGPGSRVPFLLHSAYVWELLSLGLNLAFVCLLEELAMRPMANRLATALRSRPTPPPLGLLAVDGHSARHVVALVRRGLALRPRDLGLEEGAVALAESLFEKRPMEFLEGLVRRHESVKGPEAWICRQGASGRLRRLAVPKKELPTKAPLHAYRLQAFWELAQDLGLWR
jgi:hypothetical protein